VFTHLCEGAKEPWLKVATTDTPFIKQITKLQNGSNIVYSYNTAYLR